MTAEIRFLCPGCNRFSLVSRVEVSVGKSTIKCDHCSAEFLERPDLPRVIVEDAGPVPE